MESEEQSSVGEPSPRRVRVRPMPFNSRRVTTLLAAELGLLCRVVDGKLVDMGSQLRDIRHTGGCRGQHHGAWDGTMMSMATLRLLLIAGTNFSEFSGNQQNR